MLLLVSIIAFVIILIALICALILYKPCEKLTGAAKLKQVPPLGANGTMRLCIITMFKNERHIINEWIDHHISVGFDHIYLMDNESMDEYTIDESLKPYVTITPYTSNQLDVYNKNLPLIKKNADWIAVVDLDEFIYSKRGGVRKHLESLPPHVSRVDIQMKLYCMSSFKDPKSKIGSQSHYIPDSKNHPKCISRTQGLTELGIHKSISRHNHRIYYPHTSDELCINHYRFQSVEYLYGIKEQRGGGVTKHKYTDLKVLENAMRSKSHIKDTWLKEHSTELILRCESRDHQRPATHIYPNSSWQKRKQSIMQLELSSFV